MTTDDTTATPQIYLPGEMEMMAARGAIIDTLMSVADGNLELSRDVLDIIIKSVVVSLRWRPPNALPAGPSIAGWQATKWIRVVLSDGTVWCESSDMDECREALHRIRDGSVTTYAPSAYGRTYGPDPNARLERLWERCGREWMPDQ